MKLFYNKPKLSWYMMEEVDVLSVSNEVTESIGSAGDLLGDEKWLELL